MIPPACWPTPTDPTSSKLRRSYTSTFPGSSDTHVFPYSPRPGTSAFHLADTVTKQEKRGIRQLARAEQSLPQRQQPDAFAEFMRQANQADLPPRQARKMFNRVVGPGLAQGESFQTLLQQTIPGRAQQSRLQQTLSPQGGAQITDRDGELRR